MIAVDLRPVIKSSMTRIKPEAINLAKPLVDSIALLATDVRKRVSTTGRAARGTFSKYSAKSRRRGPKRFHRSGTMWNSLRVRLQQPTRATAGFSGKADRGFSRRRDRTTGRNVLRRGRRGRYIGLGNIELARILQSKEKAQIIAPTTSETGAVQWLMGAALSQQAIRALGFEALQFRAERRARSAQRRAKKARRELARRR